MSDVNATSPVRPDYGSTHSPSRRRGVRMALLLAMVVVGVFAGWAKGRGYKTAILRAMFPEDPTYLKKPTVVAVRPDHMAGGIRPDAFIAADVKLPNPGRIIDRSTLEGGVQLLKGNAREKVPAIVNTSGGGDAIVLRPLAPLELNALYSFEVLPALKDTGGAAFEHFTSTFSTAAGTVYSEFPAAGVKVEQTSSAGNWYTGLQFGPDGRLYASTIAGQVVRFDVAPDGTLGAPTVITTVLARNQGPRIMTGLVFDPASTRDNPIVYVAHGIFPFDRLPEGDNVRSRAGTPHPMSNKVIADWSGKISRLSGRNLEKYEDIVVGLPRARHDHTTGQIAFGPDGAMYFAQASNTAMGEPDHEWGFRPERLLTACVMRLDLKRLPQGAPLNVQTEETPTPYDPFAEDAPLTIYATGSRNTYDIVFHRNGQMYGTLNGSARGGNTPAGGATAARRIDHATAGAYTGPAVPGLTEVGTQNDFLFRIERGGYYGHPNPSRAEFVMNGGNPTAGVDAVEVAEYPAGTQPDRNYRYPTFDFGKNLSPCGLIEYRGDAFPALRGKLLVVRFSGGKDILALTPGAGGDITEFVANLDGFTHFFDPVDLCESPTTGYLYVAEHTGRRITMVKPKQGVSTQAIREPVTPPGQLPPAPRLPVVTTDR